MGRSCACNFGQLGVGGDGCPPSSAHAGACAASGCSIAGPAGVLRLITVHVDPSWSRPVLRRVFGEIQASTRSPGVVSFVGGEFNSIMGTEVRFRREAGAAAPGDGTAGDIADGALEHLLEFQQPSWTLRRFAGRVLDVASRIDRIYASLPSVALSFLSGSCAVNGQLFDRDSAIDHLPVMLLLRRRRRRRDARVLPPFDRRIFECERFYKVLASRIRIESCATVADAQAQLTAFKLVAREVSGQCDLRSFQEGVPTARDKARLAIRAQAMWIQGRRDEVRRLLGVWPALRTFLTDEGGLRAEDGLVDWIAGLTEAEVAEEIARVSAAATPEWQKGQARERVQQRAARWRVRKRRVALQGLVSAQGEALVDARAQGREISRRTAKHRRRRRSGRSSCSWCPICRELPSGPSLLLICRRRRAVRATPRPGPTGLRTRSGAWTSRRSGRSGA